MCTKSWINLGKKCTMSLSISITNSRFAICPLLVLSLSGYKCCCVYISDSKWLVSYEYKFSIENYGILSVLNEASASFCVSVMNSAHLNEFKY